MTKNHVPSHSLLLERLLQYVLPAPTVELVLPAVLNVLPAVTALPKNKLLVLTRSGLKLGILLVFLVRLVSLRLSVCPSVNTCMRE